MTCNIDLKPALQRSIGLGGLKTSKLHALKNVSGVLKPVGY